jgi:ferric-dicitrate binding protein FerR (iron transport regulator)
VGTVGAVAWRHNQAVPAAPQPAREYATARGQRSEVTLVDGTRAWLNADSRLRVPSRYGVGARNVELEGEAFFVVRHDEKRPFRVYTRDAVSEDLGTEFSVRSYPEDSAVVVVVASGRVAMGRAGTPADSERKVALGRGQMGRLDRAGHVTVTDGVDLSGPLGWREGRLEFDQKPLADVLRELGRWYALEIVAGVVGLRYVREGRQVRLLARPLRH